MVILRRAVKGVLLILLVITALCEATPAQDIVRVSELTPLPPDSFYVRREGGDIVIGWYPAPDSLSAVIGSWDFSNWFSDHSQLEGSIVTFTGAYSGNVDRSLIFQRSAVEQVTVGIDTSIALTAITDDMYDTYIDKIDIGTNYYTSGESIPLILIGEESGDTLELGIGITFGEGVVDTSRSGGPAYFDLDLQDFEGFHIWRGLDPYPSLMSVISEISKEDAFNGVDWDSLYFEEWPKVDNFGREYFEWTDENVFVGFTYDYIVTTYDRGYFKGFFQYNKKDNFVCHEECGEVCDDVSDNKICDCDTTVFCRDVVQELTMTVNAGIEFNRVYAVPNPFRTGTSVETSSFYANFPDNTIKFFNVPENASIKIFTVAGDLVWKGFHGAISDDGLISWDTRNDRGEEVCSGVYIFRSEGENGEDVYGRLIIIR